MTSNGPGSIYHLSSLRYAQGSKSSTAYVSEARHASPVQSSASRQLFRHFENAEDEYRPGQSSSSSLMIRSNVMPTDALTTDASATEARESFQRTKVRSILAQSIPIDENQVTDPFLGVQISDVGSSIYLHNRRARFPLSRASYDRERKKKRMAKKRAKLRERSEATGEGNTIDEHQALQDKEEEAKAESITRDMQADADLLRKELPSGSLMQTIHYLAAHYYGSRDLLRPRDSSGKKRVQGQKINMWRGFEGNALVALAVYLEELIKYETTAEPDLDLHRTSVKDNAMVAGQLAALQRDMKNKTRRKTKRKQAKKLFENNWAKTRRKKKPRKIVGMQNSNSVRENADEEGVSEGEEEDEDENEDEEEEDADGDNSDDHDNDNDDNNNEAD